MQRGMIATARALRKSTLVTDITSLDALGDFFDRDQGFVLAKWSELIETEAVFKEFGVTVRCLPYEQSGTTGAFIATGEAATTDAILAKAY
jgi:hypothetical protein